MIETVRIKTKKKPQKLWTFLKNNYLKNKDFFVEIKIFICKETILHQKRWLPLFFDLCFLSKMTDHLWHIWPEKNQFSNSRSIFLELSNQHQSTKSTSFQWQKKNNVIKNFPGTHPHNRQKHPPVSITTTNFYHSFIKPILFISDAKVKTKALIISMSTGTCCCIVDEKELLVSQVL